MNAVVDLQELVRLDRQDALVRLMASPSGLPFADLIIDLSDGAMVRWSTDGEVRTVKP